MTADSYLTRIQSNTPTAEIVDKLTALLVINESDIAELFLEASPTAEYVLQVLTVTRDHLAEVEAFIRTGLAQAGNVARS